MSDKYLLPPISQSKMIPLYYRIYIAIKKEIESGNYKAKSKMPSENELAKNYNVSKMTIRNALSKLEEEGLIYKEVGRGTFISEKKFEMKIRKILSYTDDVINRGFTPSSKEIRKKIIKDLEIAKIMGLPCDASLFELIRIRLADDIPLAIEWAYVNASLCPGIENYDFNGDLSLYKISSEKYGIQIENRNDRVEVRNIDFKTAKILSIKPKSACFYFHRLTRTINGEIFEYTKSYFRGDKYYYIFDLRA